MTAAQTELIPTAQTGTARDLIAMLRRHYLPENRPPAGLFCPEIGSPDGKRRADLIWAPITSTQRTGLVGHEVKVSRSDLAAELTDLTKPEPWMQYCGRWWLVVADPSIVAGFNVPEEWGIMAPPSGRRTRSMTIVRPAPNLKPKDPAPGLQRIIEWSTYRYTEQKSEMRRRIDELERTKEYNRQEIERLRLNGHTAPDRATELVLSAVKGAEKELNLSGCWERVTQEDVIAAITDSAAARGAAKDMLRIIGTVRRQLASLAAPMKQSLGDIERLEKRFADETGQS